MEKQRVKNKAPKRDANAAVRAAMAVNLRAQKLRFDDIAKQCGYASAGACYNAIQRELQRTVVTNVEQLRREELVILDRLHAECWDLAMDKENKGRLFAVDRLLAIAERRAKLMGLDIPVDNAVAAASIVIREVPQGWLAASAQEVKA